MKTEEEISLEYRRAEWNSAKIPCANYIEGCRDFCTYVDKDALGYKIWRPFCSSCHKASYGEINPRTGEVAMLKESVKRDIRTGLCTNINSRIGFRCPMRDDIKPYEFPTEIDHIDANKLNNKPENLQELCEACHTKKSMLNGDYKRKNKNVMTKPRGCFQSFFDNNIFQDDN